MNIQKIISTDIKKALINFGVSENYNLEIFKTSKMHIGDYQSNAIMKIAKQLKTDPYNFAKNIIKLIKKNNIYENISVSKPGFINIILNRQWLSKILDINIHSHTLGIAPISPETIIVDYSSPNIAKEMHIGHLRSTIIGDATVRILEFIGHNVIRVNHIGDWGTQFGMLLAYLKVNKNFDFIKNISLKNIEKLYQKAKKKYDEDQNFAKLSRQYVVKLQSGDLYCQYLWKKMTQATINYNKTIYKKLHITLQDKHIMGESAYNTMLPKITEDLKNKGIAVYNQGALVVLLDKIKNRQGHPMGVIIKKKDGGYVYAIIDIACIKYRCEILKADKIIYYTDSRQHQYLLQIWEIARKAGYVSKHVLLEHHMFGMILSKNRHPFKTRSGNTVKLNILLNEGIDKAKNILLKKNPHLSAKDTEKLSTIIGIGAIKYADLRKNRTTDYIFNWDEMLSFEGNTALYIQYAYTRIISIMKKSNIDVTKITSKIQLIEPYEIELALHLLQFEEKILYAANQGTPHVICNYLYQLSGTFSKFYENCSILFAKKTAISHSRLKLSFLTAKTIKKGLNLLGIYTMNYI
ncbi:arginine--tRNA ligase [Buchnera aphidicola (Formosaphis micheliae)]|uniref:arginine--tRNA ligase n=1 Tax=Buchnera aphidicola TaxID=9 RepID=UPI0031B8AF91